jgi:UDP-glucose 4-epimerase
MRVLLTGGAGFIGSHTTISLIEEGHEPVIVDNFSNSKPLVIDRIEQISGVRPAVHRVDLRDESALDAVFAEVSPDSVIHFAALKAVGESARKPLEYYSHNLDATFSLLKVMRDRGVFDLVFSSSATVYGDRAPVPYVETYEPLEAASPYGQTKVMIERVLNDLARAERDWRFAVLRYFNPVGAHPSGLIGEDPRGIPNNLTPFITQVAVGRRDFLTIHGGDYPTQDGTAERDYLHVVDLAIGHIRALETLPTRDPGVHVWNLGTGHASSVREVVAAFERAVGHEIAQEVGPRRPGDLSAFWADATKAKADLGWVAERGLDDMARDAWAWQSSNPDGYPD